METPLGKVSATPPIANLVHDAATHRVKRRKLGGRVIRQFSPEITDIWSGDVVYLTEANTCIPGMGEDMRGSAGLEVSHAVQ